jgi:hypothetical protein
MMFLLPGMGRKVESIYRDGRILEGTIRETERAA